jgi:DNA-binding transcriptional ArsR family regulator
MLTKKHPGDRNRAMDRSRTQTIREFILDQAAMNPMGLARRIAEAYGISRQAANRHLDLLVEAGLLEESGRTRARAYQLRRTSSLSREVRVTPVLNPDRVWEDHIAPVLASDRPSVRDLCHGAFNELVRSAMEREGASWIQFSFASDARDIDLAIIDDGAALFDTLQKPLGAASVHEAATMLANLANARVSDSPVARLVLLARNFQFFTIRSSGVELAFSQDTGAWTVSDDDSPRKGTTVAFQLRRPAVSAARAVTRRGAAVTR